MSGPSKPSLEPIESRDDLVAYLESGGRPKSEWRIGTEHEKFVFRKSDFTRPGYDGPDGIEALFLGLTKYGYEPVRERGSVVALSRADGCSVTYEPGGQVELSGAALETVHQTCFEVNSHLKETKEVGEGLGVGLLGVGFDPKWRREDIQWMPKARYEIMRSYMPTRGNLGIDMMIRTCTIQVNLDFANEADMVTKLRTSLALQPLATALFANSPFTEGKENGLQSMRSQVWTHTDPDRSSVLPFAFEEGMGFSRYVDYALDVPMYFVHRDGNYIDCKGLSFRDFIDGKLATLPGEKPTMGDWADHLTTIFPEVRLKRYLEQRGSDGGPWARICALPAFWVGLLYDEDTLAAAWNLVSGWSAKEVDGVRQAVPKMGLATPLPGGKQNLGDLAIEVLALSKKGLEKRNRKDSKGRTEEHFLTALNEIAARRESPAEKTLRMFREDWGGDIDRIYKDCAY